MLRQGDKAYRGNTIFSRAFSWAARPYFQPTIVLFIQITVCVMTWYFSFGSASSVP